MSDPICKNPDPNEEAPEFCRHCGNEIKEHDEFRAQPSMPPEVCEAFVHLRQKYPACDINLVVFTSEGRWCYMSKDSFQAVKFGNDVDVSILEKALDVVDNGVGFPAVFEFEG